MKDRIKKVMDDSGLSASKFADKIGVQRSGLSHILSGRNKPSLDYVLKVINAFPDIDPYWLIKGKKSTISNSITSSNDQDEVETNTSNINQSLEAVNRQMGGQVDQMLQKIIKEPKKVSTTSESDRIALSQPSNNLERIVYFYNDGTFKEYIPR